MIRAFLLGMAGCALFYQGCEALAHGLGYECRANAASQHRAFVGFADGAGQAVSTKGFNPISQGETR